MLRMYGFAAVLSALFSCTQKDSPPVLVAGQDTTVLPLQELPEPKKLRYEIHLSDSLKIDEVLLNGHPVLLSPDDFALAETVDSSDSWPWLCGAPRMVSTETEPEITTSWCDNREYISGSEGTLIQYVQMDQNTFSVPSRKLLFTAETTLDEFREHFGKSVTYALQDNDYKADGMLRCKVMLKSYFDDCWIFDFKDGKLYSITLWWLLC